MELMCATAYPITRKLSESLTFEINFALENHKHLVKAQKAAGNKNALEHF